MSVRNPGALIEEHIRRSKLQTFLKDRKPQGLLLDLGCGERPYRDLYEMHFERTLGADLADTPFPTGDVDIRCSATAVPLPAASVDMILCTEVLHDLPEPDAFFNEVKRLLKPGGILFLTSPFVVPIVDGKFDHYRYTETGLSYRIRKSGLEVLQISPVGDLISSAITLLIKPPLRTFNYLAKKSRIRMLKSAWNPLFLVFVLLPQLLYLGLCRGPVQLVFRKGAYGATGYVSIARNPA